MLLFLTSEIFLRHPALHGFHDLHSERLPLLGPFLTAIAGRSHGGLKGAQPIMQWRCFLTVVPPAFQGFAGGGQRFGNPPILGEHLADFEIRGGHFVVDDFQFPLCSKQGHAQVQRGAGLFQHGIHTALLVASAGRLPGAVPALVVMTMTLRPRRARPRAVARRERRGACQPLRGDCGRRCARGRHGALRGGRRRT